MADAKYAVIGTETKLVVNFILIDDEHEDDYTPRTGTSIVKVDPSLPADKQPML